jgi:hypothetical protein
MGSYGAEDSELPEAFEADDDDMDGDALPADMEGSSSPEQLAASSSADMTAQLGQWAGSWGSQLAAPTWPGKLCFVFLCYKMTVL